MNLMNIYLMGAGVVWLICLVAAGWSCGRNGKFLGSPVRDVGDGLVVFVVTLMASVAWTASDSAVTEWSRWQQRMRYELWRLGRGF